MTDKGSKSSQMKNDAELQVKNSDCTFVSVVVPAKNEAGNLPGLLNEIAKALESFEFEVLVVDDGSTDGTAESVMQNSGIAEKQLRVLQHSESCGQSAAVLSGLLHSTGDIVVTIDGDGQNNPAYIPELLNALEDGGPKVAMAGGQRTGRKAGVFKRIASRFANRLRRRLLKDNASDSGCGLKAIRREVFLRLPYFDSWHRFLPSLVIREGFAVVYVEVVDRERRFGASKYGVLDRALVGILDLLGVWWLGRRRKKKPVVAELATGGDSQ